MARAGWARERSERLERVAGGLTEVTPQDEVFRRIPGQGQLGDCYQVGPPGAGVPGGTDWLGYDNGSRALPADMPSHLNEYESATNPAIKEKITTLGRELNNFFHLTL